MPPLPCVSGLDAVQALQRDGWKLDRQRGSHMVMIKAGSCFTLSVPNHRELDRGTLRAIIRQSGLTVDEFLRLL